MGLVAAQRRMDRCLGVIKAAVATKQDHLPLIDSFWIFTWQARSASCTSSQYELGENPPNQRG